MNTKTQFRTIAFVVLSVSASVSCAAGVGQDTVTYRAQPGDTLIGISQKYLAKPAQWKQLQKLNQVNNDRAIPVGSQLRIPVALLRSTDAAATVVSLNGAVTVNGAAPVLGAKLATGSRIVTGDSGYLLLRLADATLLTIQAQSRVVLESLKRYSLGNAFDSTINLQDGRVDSDVTKVTGPAPRYRIRTPSAVASVRGTQFRVAADGSKKVSRSEVIGGLVNVADADASAAVGVPAGFGTVVPVGQPPSQPVALLPAPDVSALATLQARPLVRFTLPNQTGAVAYRGQIAANKDFQPLLMDQLFNNTSLRFLGLPDGAYWLKVRAIDGVGLEGQSAILAFVLKARPEPPFITSPKNNGKLSGESASLNWTLADDAASYHLQLSRGNEFKTLLVDKAAIQGGTFTTPTLTPGEYDWRIASVRADGDQGPYGDVQHLVLKPLPATPAPPAIGAQEISLGWQGEPGQSFELQMSRDKTFKQDVKEYRLSQASVSLPKPAWGTYFFRIRAIDADGYVGPYTAVQRFDIPLPDWYWLK